MRNDFFYDSHGSGKIHACCWEPDGPVKGIVQIVHGLAEHIRRYDDFAAFLNAQGYLVVGQDHMGHGKSVGVDGVKGYFHGGWFTAVEDVYTLLTLIQEKYPGTPYILFGHSMGSFMVRTILTKYPQCPLAGCVICGTGWQPQAALNAGIRLANLICRMSGAKKPSKLLIAMVFGTYNRKIERPLTPFDWVSRENKVVNSFMSDPLGGFMVSAGLMRDMFTGIAYIQQESSLANMNKQLPVHLIAGGDDPVGTYGEGVRKTADAFKQAGMERVTLRIFPMCRHEILNEINRKEVWQNIGNWIGNLIK